MLRYDFQYLYIPRIVHHEYSVYVFYYVTENCLESNFVFGFCLGYKYADVIESLYVGKVYQAKLISFVKLDKKLS